MNHATGTIRPAPGRAPSAAMLLLLLLLLSVSAFGPASAQPPGGESPRAARIRADASSILSSPVYGTRPTEKSWAEQAWKWVGDRLSDLWDWFRRLFSFGARATGGGTAFMWLVLVALALGIAWAIAYALRVYKPGRRARRAAPDVSADPTDAELARMDPDALLASAEALAARGEYRRALRAVFVATLLRMDRIGAIRFEPARTNGEYLRALRERPELLAILRPLSLDFDRRWYGGLESSEADYRRFRQSYERVTAGGQPA